MKNTLALPLFLSALAFIFVSCANIETEQSKNNSVLFGLTTKASNEIKEFSQMESYWLLNDSIVKAVKLTEDS